MTILNNELLAITFGGTNNVIGDSDGGSCTETPIERAIREMLGSN